MQFKDPEPIEYYSMVIDELPGFWARFGGQPNFKGKKVLDLGCGHGALVNTIAASGAAKVVGLDLEQDYIDFATSHQQETYPELNSIVEFHKVDIQHYPEDGFDYMVSKATFEHVIKLDEVVLAMRDRLKIGGQLYTGFGPLYYSPFGDHTWTLSKLPWGHAMSSDAAIIKRVNATRSPERQIESIYDLGLNKMTPNDYRQLFNNVGMKVVLYRENVMMPKSSFGRQLFGKALDVLKAIPFMDKYATVNIWCILEKI